MELSKTHKFIFRFFVIFSIHLMIKGFDQSFGPFFEFAFRGIVFSIFFNSFWIIVWYGADYLNKRIASLGQFERLIINLVYGYSASFLTNYLYKMGDVHLFNNEHLWKDISFFNPELTISLLLLYFLGYSINGYYQNQIGIKEEQLKNEKLERENLLAQYRSLKAQIEPHFLFNSLSVLSSVVHSDANLASEFIVKLSKTLRYIIEKNEFDLVMLKDELTMVNNYYFLLKTRFKESIQISNTIDNSVYENSMVPPVSIQMLIENAVKHNKFSEENPLKIELSNNENFFIIKNTLNKRREETESTSTGLNNIKKRYQLISDELIKITETEQHFVVQLPILSKNNYEGFNN